MGLIPEVNPGDSNGEPVKRGPGRPRKTQDEADAGYSPEPRKIARMKFIAAINFNRTENNTLDRERDKCVLVQTALGVEATGEKFNEAVLIPWANIVYVKFS